MTVGKFLKRSRLSSGKSQRLVARKLGWTTAQFVSNVERDTAKPAKNTAFQWCKIVKADPEELCHIWVNEFGDELANYLRLS